MKTTNQLWKEFQKANPPKNHLASWTKEDLENKLTFLENSSGLSRPQIKQMDAIRREINARYIGDVINRKQSLVELHTALCANESVMKDLQVTDGLDGIYESILKVAIEVEECDKKIKTYRHGG